MYTNEKIRASQSLKVNGRSFHWASLFLTRSTKDKAAQLYAFCRDLDDLADGNTADGAARLAKLNSRLRKTRNAPVRRPQNGGRFLMRRHFRNLYLPPWWMDWFATRKAPFSLGRERDLLRYAYRVAGTVGLLMCDVLNCHTREAKGHAVDLGIAMQLTNISRDVLEDARMGRRYIPGEWVSGLSPRKFAPPLRQQILQTISVLRQQSHDFWHSPINIIKVVPKVIAICPRALVFQSRWRLGSIVKSGFS